MFREARDHSLRWSFSVRNGDVVLMADGCQERLQHSVAVERALAWAGRAGEVGPRMSLVFKRRLPGTLGGGEGEGG
ncbi:hypothetical protein [Bosea sp. (in: a-proteobacteria)]|uniref:hypothetical protein n=1 Tax=Bosea sp. (in: a-proteobacteria) TaxID=1871050 RepID=UPI0040341E8F